MFENISISQSEQNLRIFTKTLINLIIQTPNLDFSFDKDTNSSDINYTTNSGYEDGDYFIKTVSKNNLDFRITIINPDGKVLADSVGIPSKMENHLSRPEVKKAFDSGEGLDIHLSSVYKKDLIYYASKFIYGDKQLVIRVSMPTTTSVFFAKNTQIFLILTALIIIIIVLLCSFYLTKKLLSPLDDITAATVAYEQGDFSYRPKIVRPQELANLSNRMVSMAKTIENNIHAISIQRDEIEALFNNTTEAIIVFDGNLQIIKYNERAEKMFLIDNNTIQNKSLISLVRNTEIVNFVNEQIYNMQLNNGKNTGTEEELESIINQPIERFPIYALIRCSLINTNQNTLSSNLKKESLLTLQNRRYILTLTNITRLKRLERIRKDFVANVSHELKTPITSIQGFVETLQDGAIEEPETAKNFLHIIHQESIRMVSIINDLLTISQLEQGQTQLEKNPLFINDILNSVVNYYKELALKKNITISTELYNKDDNKIPTTNFKILGNSGMLEQAIGNIVNNSVKYCPEGSLITIKTNLISMPTDTEKYIQIIIQDNGQGIPKEAQDRVFERFYRIDKGRSRDQGGTGLGLSISRHIILLHNGLLYCKTRPDNLSGAHFVIKLPLLSST
jgi:two-component system phosphate regulon sensor histidine kinase PhoR